MALNTWTALKTSVADWLNRADLTAVVPDFITLAEAQINRRLLMAGPVRQMMARDDLSIDAEFVTVPEDFAGTRSIYIDGEQGPLFYAEPEKIDELLENFTTLPSGNPTRFSVVGGEFRFYPWNGTTVAAKLTYWQRIPALGGSQATNWLLDSHPDAYLYGALLQSAPYLKADARIGVWGNAFETILSDIVTADKIERNAPQLALSPVLGGTP
jgi:hypothetical protein